MLLLYNVNLYKYITVIIITRLIVLVILFNRRCCHSTTKHSLMNFEQQGLNLSSSWLTLCVGWTWIENGWNKELKCFFLSNFYNIIFVFFLCSIILMTKLSKFSYAWKCTVLLCPTSGLLHNARWTCFQNCLIQSKSNNCSWILDTDLSK